MKNLYEKRRLMADLDISQRVKLAAAMSLYDEAIEFAQKMKNILFEKNNTKYISYRNYENALIEEKKYFLSVIEKDERTKAEFAAREDYDEEFNEENKIDALIEAIKTQIVEYEKLAEKVKTYIVNMKSVTDGAGSNNSLNELIRTQGALAMTSQTSPMLGSVLGLSLAAEYFNVLRAEAPLRREMRKEKLKQQAEKTEQKYADIKKKIAELNEKYVETLRAKGYSSERIKYEVKKKEIIGSIFAALFLFLCFALVVFLFWGIFIL